MRAAYEQHGVAGYYQQYATSYRNPHFEPLLKALSATLSEVFGADPDRLINPPSTSGLGTAEQDQAEPGDAAEPNTLRVHAGGDLTLRVLDLACGSGEASIVVHRWLQATMPRVELLRLTACDPFTQAAFTARTGLPRAAPWSFEDVAAGVLEGRRFDLVVCTFAMHLLDDSKLFATLHALSRAARWLVLASPHKRPLVKGGSGWGLAAERVVERVHVRVLESANAGLEA